MMSREIGGSNNIRLQKIPMQDEKTRKALEHLLCAVERCTGEEKRGAGIKISASSRPSEPSF